MGKLKTAAELAKLSGPSLGRAVKAIRTRITQLKSWINNEKSTPKRVSELGRLQNILDAKKGVPSQKRPPPKVKPIDRPKHTRRERKEIKRLTTEQKLDDKGITSQSVRTTDILTPEGEALWFKNTPESLAELLKNITKYKYSGGRQTPVSLHVVPRPGTTAERIESRLGQRPPTLTRRQVAEEMGLKGKGTLPSEEELRATGGYEIFKKGGYKKYQSRSKLGKREHVYIGGGVVGDIPHFRPKKKVRKK